MNLSAAFLRRFHWINLSGAVLIALLQRTPVVRVAATVGEIVHASPVGMVLRSAVAAVASLGAVHSLAGATQFVTNPNGTPSGTIRGTVGTALTVSFTINGSPLPPTFFTLESSLPPGLSTIPAVSAGNRINSRSPIITGTPTQAGTFNVSVTGSDGIYTETDTITFIIAGGSNVAPAITTQPAAQTVPVGTSVTFSVVATGTPAPTYQWRKDGAAIAGATGASFTRTSVITADAGAYSVVVTNSVSSVTSNSATLVVNDVSATPAITTQPVSQTGVVGGGVVFSVVATGNPSPTYQWLKNSIAISGASSASLSLGNLTLADAAVYVVNVTNSFGTVTSVAATLTVNAAAIPPAIASQPPSTLALVAGQSLALNLGATGTGLKYQWRKTVGGVTSDIAGATSPLFTIKPVAASDAATYQCVVSNSDSPPLSVTSQGCVVTVDSASAADPGRLINLSVLTSIDSPGDNFSLGYVVSGATATNPKPLVLRAAGPSLGAFGLAGTIADPKMVLFAGSNQTTQNDNWGGVASVANAMSAVGAFPYTGPTSLDAALVASVTSRDNSVAISAGASAPSGTGFVLGEVYDATPSGTFSAATTPRLINLSVRKNVGGGLTMGFVIGGTKAKTMLVRAVGPTLGGFGVNGTIADPKVELFDSGGKTIATNDNWGGLPALTSAFSDTGAFTFSSVTSTDAALLVTLAPGNYTAKVSVSTGATGVALVEVYEAP